MDNMRKQAENSSATILDEYVTKVNLKEYPFHVHTYDEVYKAESLIISTGAEALWLNATDENVFKVMVTIL